ncbi:MAG: electron transfer flavoprotein subunit alpha/FixB family protein [Candidatus Omnitrophica bacterium]|nr:electron transfer flavoprotein subunit alpha/FixB family protein [Candidatus Omnitrophota bacterium]
MSQDVNVFVEIQNDQIRKVTSQLVSAGRPLAEARGGKLRGILVGKGSEQLAPEAAKLGFDQVVFIEDPALDQYSAEGYDKALVGAMQELKGALIVGNTAIGKDIGPGIAQRLGLGMVSDIVETVSTDGNPAFKRPIYAGRAYETIEIQEADFVLSVRANSYPSAEPTDSAAEISKLDIPLGAEKFRTTVKEVIERASGKVDLTEADIVVSGGMGVKGPEGFDTLRPLCDVLGAALGSSRAAVLAEYIHPSHQVGQTGKTVSPSLYIACGISGAIQHQAGMSTSKCIVAINTDPDAPIFEIADYGIVGDLFEVVPLLTEEFKKLLG